jgi:hypothetical protein
LRVGVCPEFIRFSLICLTPNPRKVKRSLLQRLLLSQPITVSSGTTWWGLEDLQRYDRARSLQQDLAMVTKRSGGAA